MHQHPILTNKVSMEILNLKVVNQDRLSKFFKFKVSNFDFITISSNKSVTNFEISCSYPTLILNIEWVVCGSVNGFAIRSFKVQDFVSFLDPGIQNLFKFCFACFVIVGKNLIANGNIFRLELSRNVQSGNTQNHG